jgi:hypothetical protein
MRDEEDGELLLLVQTSQKAQQSVFGSKVETIRGFIEDQDAGPPNQRPGHQRALALPAGQGPIIFLLESSQTHLIQSPPQALAALVRGGGNTHQAQQGELAHRRRQGGVDITALRHKPDTVAASEFGVDPQLAGAGG